jgi:hypothetical protein
MAVGEFTIKDPTFLNVANTAFTPGQVVILDIANSTNGPSVALPGAALVEPIGVIVDKTKLSPIDSSVEPNQGIGVRQIGWAWCIASGAVAIGDHVSVANTSGQVQTQARAGAGVQPVPIVGRAYTAASSAGQGVLVNLTIGATY